MGKFIVWQLKRWLVPALVILGVMTMSMVIMAASESLTYEVNNMTGDPMHYGMANNMFIAAVIYGSIISIVFPMFVFNYKFGIRRADFYKQLPFEKNELRRIILVMGLVIVMMGVLVSFSLGLGLYLIRYFTYDKSSLITTEYTTEKLYSFDYKYLIFFILLLMFTVFATYSISSLFVYHNVTVFEAILAVILAQLFLGLFSWSIVQQVNSLYFTYTGEEPQTIYLTFSFVSPVIAASNMNDLFVGLGDGIWKNLYWNVGTYFLLGIGAFVWLFLVKDRSADVENEKGKPAPITLVAVHGGFLSVMLFANMLAGYTIYISLIINIFVIATYFFINVLYRHGFKLKLEQWIPIAASSLVAIADAIVLAA